MNRPISGRFQVVSDPNFHPASRHRRLFKPPIESPARLRFEVVSLCAADRPHDVLEARLTGGLAEQWKGIAYGMTVTATGFIRPRLDGEVCFGEPLIISSVDRAEFETTAPPQMREFRW